MKYKIGECTFSLILQLIEAIEKMDDVSNKDFDDCPNALDDFLEARWKLIHCIASVAIGDYVAAMKQKKETK